METSVNNRCRAFTSLEQSKKLAEILPIESADMWWAERYAGQVMANGQYIVEEKPVYYPSLTKPSNDNYSQDTVKDIPCWSLAALRNLLPVGIEINENAYLFESHNTFDNSWVYRYYNEDDTSYLYYKNTSEINACVEMIIKLHELNLL